MWAGILAFLGGLVGLASRKQEIKAEQATEHRKLSAPEGKPASWRNALGWICSLILAYHLLIRDLILWTAYQFGYSLKAELPLIDNGIVLKLIFAMLGVMD